MIGWNTIGFVIKTVVEVGFLIWVAMFVVKLPRIVMLLIFGFAGAMTVFTIKKLPKTAG